MTVYETERLTVRLWTHDGYLAAPLPEGPIGWLFSRSRSARCGWERGAGTAKGRRAGEPARKSTPRGLMPAP
ncbi:hypothetical protein [Streptosporangium roseum]|uniref:hypothetical protein n=1 Tax=Streptosporangium roseum TaxID=2001 RepID=UPI0004CDC119|nr:hypothetical protein [Streptosporangium roseum]